MPARLVISKKDCERFNRLMAMEHVDLDKEELDEDCVVYRKTVEFGGGRWADLEVVTTQDGTLWCQMVWFDNGAEFCCSDVSDTLDGVWHCCSEIWTVEVVTE